VTLQRLIICLTVLFFVTPEASSQPSTMCQGPFQHSTKIAPFELIVNASVETGPDYKFVVTCVQSKVSGFLRFRWHIPDHRVDLDSQVPDEKRRPLSLDALLEPSPGCFSYGNLTNSDRSEFYATRDQLQDVERERTNGCPKTLAEITSTPPQSELDRDSKQKPSVPRRVKYLEEARFFAGPPEKEKGITHVTFEIDFMSDEKEKSGDLIIGYDAISPERAPRPSDRGFSLKPFGVSSEARVLKEMFRKKVGSAYQIQDSGKIVLRYPISTNTRFGSSELGIHDRDNQLLTSFWIPVLY
jgi:hypothetical protein